MGLGEADTGWRISTHVSARRRTFSQQIPFKLTIFQFTSPQGDEHKIPLPPQVDRNFNSRLRKETNTFCWITIYQLHYFNSRLRKETNVSIQVRWYLCLYFNSRLRKETNAYVVSTVYIVITFQLTSPRGDELRC